MILSPAELNTKDRHKLLIGTIVPRPIAWVSTISASGQFNLAPYSFFTVGARNPMTLIFCPQVPQNEAREKKDTLANIEQIPEFVVNLTNEATAEAMNLTATLLPHGQSEFEWAGLTPVASDLVRAPRVAEAPVSFECVLQQIVTISDAPGGGYAVFGEVLRIHIRDDIYQDSYVNLKALRPIGRLAGSDYTRVTDLFEMERRPPLEK
jgi:flavin reductase (DIM6/NTAB) family NADH-FMN oxidoreductase RutF